MHTNTAISGLHYKEVKLIPYYVIVIPNFDYDFFIKTFSDFPLHVPIYGKTFLSRNVFATKFGVLL